MKNRRIKDKEKGKYDNIKKKNETVMGSKFYWEYNPSNDDVTQELGDSRISTWFFKGELELGY